MGRKTINMDAGAIEVIRKLNLAIQENRPKGGWSKLEIAEIYPWYHGKAERFDPELCLKFFKERSPADAYHLKVSPSSEIRASNPTPQVNEPLFRRSIFGCDRVFEGFEQVETKDNIKETISKEYSESLTERVRKEMQDEDVQLAVLMTVAAHSDPLLGDILPDIVKSYPSIPDVRPASIEVLDDFGYVGSIFGYDQAPFHTAEVLESIPEGIRSVYDDLHRAYKNNNQTSTFKIEEDTAFAIDIRSHPDIIAKIEGFLTCREKWNFRVAFSNVSEDSDQRAVRVEGNDLLFATTVSRRRCVCTSPFFSKVDFLKANAERARVIFNHHISLFPGRGQFARVRVEGRNTSHVESMKILDLEFTSQFKYQSSVFAWTYRNENRLQIQPGATHSDETLIKCGVKGFRQITEPLNSKEWNRTMIRCMDDQHRWDSSLPRF